MQLLNLAAGLLATVSSIALAAPLAEAGPLPPTPVEKRAAAAGTLTGIVSVTPSAGVSFGPVTIGTQVNSVAFDTGSNILWIRGSGNGPNFTTTYGSGTVYGNIAYGDVTVGGITVKNQAYGLVYKTSGGWIDGLGGIMGLGTAQAIFGSSSLSWLYQALPLLKSPVLAVNIAPGSASGTFAFGTTETAHMGSSPVWVPGNSGSNYWTVSVSSFGVSGGTDASAVCGVDTGTTDIYTPNSVATGFWSQVSGAVQDTSDASHVKYKFPCSATVPNLVTTIGGNQLTVASSNFVVTVDSSTKTCGGLLQGQTPCLLGQKFFNSWYTIFDFGAKQIGFAPRKS